jgi:hypothetical protein
VLKIGKGGLESWNITDDVETGKKKGQRARLKLDFNFKVVSH